MQETYLQSSDTRHHKIQLILYGQIELWNNILQTYRS